MNIRRLYGREIDRTVNVYSLVYALVFVTLFQPSILDNAEFIEELREGLQLVICLFLFVLLMIHKEFFLSKMEISLLCFVAWGLLLTVLYAPDMTYFYFTVTGFKVFAMLVWCKSVFRHRCPKLIRYIAGYYFALIWANALLMVLFPSGLLYSSVGAIRARANWLLGSKNQITVFGLLAILFLRLSSIAYKNKFWAFATTILLLLEAFSTGSDRVEFLGGSTTAIIILTAFSLLCFIFNIDGVKRLRKVFKIKYFALFSVIIFLLVWYFSMNPSGFIAKMINDFFSYFGKDLSFSNRRVIWAGVYDLIKRKPIIGYGYTEFLFGNSHVVLSSYSFWGSMALYYGIVGVILLLVAFFFCDRRESVAGRISEKYVMPIRLCLLMLLLVGAVNEVNWQYIVLLLEFCNHQDYINRLI